MEYRVARGRALKRLYDRGVWDSSKYFFCAMVGKRTPAWRNREAKRFKPLFHLRFIIDPPYASHCFGCRRYALKRESLAGRKDRYKTISWQTKRAKLAYLYTA